MKKNIFGLSLCAVALSGLLAVSCSTEYTYVDVVADVPAITVSPVTLSADAGTYSFYYSVTNAASDATVSCTADVSWISNLDASVVGTVYFAVDENSSDELRTGNVTLTYAYEDGAVTAKVGVIQYGQTTPSLEVDPNAVTAAYAGGTYSFGYSIYDGYDDGELTCTSDADWISDYDYSTYGTVSFTVAASEEETLRSATITVTYAYSGTSISKEVTVIQDHPGSGDNGGGDVNDIIGTYTATGYVYGGSGTAIEETWTLKIYESTKTGYDVFIDGLVPSYAGSYDGSWSKGTTSSAYIAQATIGTNTITIPTQLTGYYGTFNNTDGTQSQYLYGWYPCSQFVEGTGWYRNQNITECTFTYNESTGQWTSDYGEFLALFTYGTSASYANFQGFMDVVNPGVVLTKTSSSTSSLTTTSAIKHDIDENLVIDRFYHCVE